MNALVAGSSISHYRIVSQIGAGGMGEVYLAHDTKLDRTVALKILPAEAASDRKRMGRFVQEAKAAAALSHPNAAHIYDIGEADGTWFIAMEYVAGQSLDIKISGRPLESGEIIDISIQVADALDDAHTKGITHHDIKSANIMVTPRDQVKVLDFGLAKMARSNEPVVDSDAATQAKTEPGVLMGTVAYMSPEQALGREVDHRTDIFSLGVVMYEMAAGRRPFTGATANETLDRIIHAPPEAIGRFNYNVPAELERIIRKCLEKDRERRYQSAHEVLIDLRNLKRDLESGPRGVEEAAPTRSRNRRFFAVAALGLAGVAVVVFYLLVWRSQPIDSLAVLPFVNASGDATMEYLSDGITESLINNLSQLPRLKVMSRNSVFRYKGSETDAQKVGDALGVRAVLTGRILQRGGDLIVSAELVDVRENKQLWGERYERKVSDLLGVQREMAREISSNLRLRLSGADEGRVTRHYTESPEAYQSYLKGRFYWNKRTEEGVTKGIEYFQQAIEIDPHYALAYTGLADCYSSLGFSLDVGSLSPSEAVPKAKASAMKA